MGSPCELLVETSDRQLATRLAEIASEEAWRIEDKFSRYLRGNIVDRINASDGTPITVDAETAQLLNFANTLYDLSDGAFDITSGVLRRAWTFDGSDRIPGNDEIEACLPMLGWQKISWKSPVIVLRKGMQIDLGGIGKEYAVDKVVLSLRVRTDLPCLVNFGGDLAVTGPPKHRPAWVVGVESAVPGDPDRLIELRQGALATSGDARRYLEKDGKRYSHVLDPRSGWPVEGAPRSVTVAADTCTQAGMVSTLAMLQGAGAEAFLDGQNEQYWCRR